VPNTSDPLTITREELYELVWSKPLIELAQDFGLSDVAVAKRCRKLGVPVPGRGYWARVAAGQAPRQPKLREREDQSTDYAALTFESPRDETPEENRQPATPEEAALREKIVGLPTRACVELKTASAAVRRTAVDLKRKWRNEIVWTRGEKSGPIVQIRVSELVADRALRIAELIVAGANAVGWGFQRIPALKEETQYRRYAYQPAPEPPRYGCIDTLGELLAFRIDERNRQVEHELDEGEKARKRRGETIYPPRWDYFPSGDLRVHLLHTDSTYVRHTWKDAARRKLEEQINGILLGFLDEALDIKKRREERRQDEIRARKEEERRMRLSRRRENNAKFIRELEAQAGAWQRARMLRAYLRALRNAVGKDKFELISDKGTIDFLAWAYHYANQLDPLSQEPHDSDLMDESLTRYGSREEGIKETLSRLMGRNWQESLKILGPEKIIEDVEE
jgi:hypothetical protein